MVQTPNYKRILVIAIILISLIFIVTILNISMISIYPPSSLTYIEQLPTFYWVGLLLLIGVCIILLAESNQKYSDSLNILILFIFWIYLFVPYVLSYGIIKSLDIYGVITNTKFTIEIGHLSITGNNVYPNNFPGSFLFFATISILANIDVVTLARVYPMYSSIIVLILTYSIIRKISKSILPVMAILLLPFPNVMAPLTNASILSLLLLNTILGILQNIQNINIRHYVVCIFIIVIMVMTNPTNPLYFFISIGVAIFLGNIIFYKNNKFKILKKLIAVILTGILIELIYLITISHFAFTQLMGLIITYLNEFGVKIEPPTTIPQTNKLPTSMAPSYLFSYYLWITKLGASIFLGLLLLCILMYHVYNNKNKIFLYKVFGGYYLINMILFIGSVTIGKLVFFTRPLAYLSIALSILLGFTLQEISVYKYKKLIIISISVFFIFLILSFPILISWTDPYNVLTLSEIRGRSFIHSTFDEYKKNILLKWESSYVFSQRVYNYYELKYNLSKMYLNKYHISQAIKIYDTQGFWIYYPWR